MGPAFVETLPVRKFHGIGPATARKMEQLGIRTGLDLRAQTLDFLQQHFGKAGSYYYWAARGIDERPVRADRIRKSVGAENTFPVEAAPVRCRSAPGANSNSSATRYSSRCFPSLKVFGSSVSRCRRSSRRSAKISAGRPTSKSAA